MIRFVRGTVFGMAGVDGHFDVSALRDLPAAVSRWDRSKYPRAPPLSAAVLANDSALRSQRRTLVAGGSNVRRCGSERIRS